MKKIALLLAAILVTSLLEINAQTKNVTIDQRLSNGQQVGVLKKWEGSNWSNPFNPGSTFDFPLYSEQTILGDQNIYSGEKYNNWNSDFNNVKNHRSFNITPITDILLSNFTTTHPGITIRTSLEGTEATSGVVIFYDPWFIDYQDGQYANQLRNRGMNEAYPHQRTSPFNPNTSTEYEFGQKYNGLFLLQGYPNWAPPYYVVAVPEEQPITVHGQNRKFYPYYWTGSGVSYDYPNYNITGVVFTSSNATAGAVLKGQLMSNDQNGISSNSQRKFIKTDDNWLLSVYSSMGRIWFESSSDNGVTWKIANFDGQPLDTGEAKLPSIDYAYVENNKYWVVIVFQ